MIVVSYINLVTIVGLVKSVRFMGQAGVIVRCCNNLRARECPVGCAMAVDNVVVCDPVSVRRRGGSLDVLLKARTSQSW